MKNAKMGEMCRFARLNRLPTVTMGDYLVREWNPALHTPDP